MLGPWGWMLKLVENRVEMREVSARGKTEARLLVILYTSILEQKSKTNTNSVCFLRLSFLPVDWG